jgi:hypothetical protein
MTFLHDVEVRTKNAFLGGLTKLRELAVRLLSAFMFAPSWR